VVRCNAVILSVHDHLAQRDGLIDHLRRDSAHVVAAIDGKLYDTWDSSGETVNFYWYRKDE
jgi:hypothetical protein